MNLVFSLGSWSFLCGAFCFIFPIILLAYSTLIGPNWLSFRGFMAVELEYRNIFHSQETLLLYLAALLIIGYVLAGNQFVWLESLVVKSKANRKAIGGRTIKMGGGSSSNENKKRTTEKDNRKSNRLADSSTSSVQPRRRSGRLAHLYWKDLSGISSETDPIILVSDSSEDEVDEGKRYSMKNDEADLMTNQPKVEQRSNLKKILKSGEIVMNQATSKGAKAGRDGQDVGK